MTQPPLVHVVLGTKAQLVKMAPVLLELRRRGLRHRLLHTGQHQLTMDEMLDEFGIPGPDQVLHRGPDVVSPLQMLRWASRLLWVAARRRRRIFGDDRNGVVLVHGDTMSTLLGALMGRLAGLRVAHVEAGLRSFDLWNPFPEELTRLATFRLSHLLFCPGPWAVDNVRDQRARAIDTGANTLSDTLALARAHTRREDHLPHEPFALVSLHRTENLFRPARLEALVALVERIARDRRVLFVLHPPTRRKLERSGYIERLEANPRIELRPRYTYFDVIALMERAEFIVTDGGSIQEESSYLGVPCLLLRATTERPEGIGENVLLSRYDPRAIEDFVCEPARWRRPPAAPERSPSAVIVDALEELGDER